MQLMTNNFMQRFPHSFTDISLTAVKFPQISGHPAYSLVEVESFGVVLELHDRLSAQSTIHILSLQQTLSCLTATHFSLLHLGHKIKS